MTHPIEQCIVLDDSQRAAGVGDCEKFSIEQKKSLLALAREPVQCPISGCNRSLTISHVLSHYVHDHHDDFAVNCQEIYRNKSSTLIFDPSELEWQKNICLGMLVYGGNAEVRSSRPAERGICIHNSFLPEMYKNFDAHMPIFIMACRTSWSSLLLAAESETSITHTTDSPQQELLVLWLASGQTTKPIHCTLTLYDKLRTSSRSAILEMRHLNKSQNPRDFLLVDTNFLRLTHGEINILSQNRKEFIWMEVIVNEYESQVP